MILQILLKDICFVVLIEAPVIVVLGFSLSFLPFVRAIVPKKLTSMTLRSTSMEESRTDPRELTPALFTTMSIRPYKAIASRHLSAMEEGSERSIWSTFGE